MIAIREFVRTGGADRSDSQVTDLIRERMLMAPLFQQKEWLNQVELMLDAYGVQHQVDAADRVRDVLKKLAAEVDESGTEEAVATRQFG